MDHPQAQYNMMQGNKSKNLGLNPESLYSMALYDFETSQDLSSAAAMQMQPQNNAFHPVEEYKDMSLREILDMSDDFLIDDLWGQSSQSANAMSNMMMQAPMVSSAPVPPAPQMQFDMFNIPEPTPLPEAPLDATASVVTPAKSRKREREVSDDDTEAEKRFRSYQTGQWAEKFDELVEYRKLHGHCLVPHTFKENLPLARWVKRQRYQYKLLQEGKASTMTCERVAALEGIGFVWDSQGAAWGERLDELRQFRQAFRHCNVPSNFAENPQLATWIKCQRRQYKLYMEGKQSNMTPERINELEKLGFEWELRSYKKVRN